MAHIAGKVQISNITLLVNPVHLAFLFDPVVGKFHLGREFLLLTRQFGFMSTEGAQRLNALTIGASGKAGNTHVDTHRGARWVRRLINIDFNLKRHKPVFTAPGDGDVFDRAFDIMAFPKRYPTDFRQVDAIAIDLEALGKTECIVEKLLAELRRLGSALKEIDIRSVKVFEALLEHLRVRVRQKTVFLALLPEPQCTGSIPVSQSWHTRLIPAFIEGHDLVPDKAAGSGKLSKRLSRFQLGLKPVFIALAYDHSSNIQLVYGNVKRISDWKTLCFWLACAFGLRDQISPQCVDGCCP
jgi:hypothetical protein